MKPKTSKFLYLILSIALIIFVSCKKYPEDENRSLKKPKKRIEGKWKLKSFLIEGQDSLDFWLSLAWKGCDVYNFEYDNSPSGFISWPIGTDGGNFWSDCEASSKGGYSIIGNDSLFLTNGFYYISNSGLPTQGSDMYLILRLDKSVLKIETVVNKKTRVLIFERL